MPRVLMIKTRMPLSERKRKSLCSPPLGLMSLAAYARLKRPAKDFFKIIDERIVPVSHQEYTRLATSWNPDLIALSSLSIEADQVAELSRLFKSIIPRVPIVIGGPYASSVGKGIFENAAVDYVIRREGEEPFVQLLDHLEKDGAAPPEHIPGLFYKAADGRVKDCGPNLDFLPGADIPIPAWDLVDLDKYPSDQRMTLTPKPGPYAPLETSRGCPYGCIYCHNIFGKKFRPKPAQRVVDEIEYLIATYHVNSFAIYDDIFNMDYGRVMDICAEIKRRRLKTYFSFPNGVRGDLVDERMLRELRSVGTYHMAFAVESASPRVQKLAKKNIRLDKIKENIETAAKCGIFTWGFFMIGFPTETRREVWETIRWAMKSRLHAALFFIVIPQEGSELCRMFGARQRIGPLARAHDYHYAIGSLSDMSPWELNASQIAAYSLFFFDPRRMARILVRYPASKFDLASRALRFLVNMIALKELDTVKDGLSNYLGRHARPERDMD